MKIYITRTEKITTEVVLDSRYVNTLVFRQAKLAGLNVDEVDPRIIAKLMHDWLKTEDGIKADKVGNYMYSCSLKLYEKYLISKGL